MGSEMCIRDSSRTRRQSPLAPRTTPSSRLPRALPPAIALLPSATPSGSPCRPPGTVESFVSFRTARAPCLRAIFDTQTLAAGAPCVEACRRITGRSNPNASRRRVGPSRRRVRVDVVAPFDASRTSAAAAARDGATSPGAGRAARAVRDAIEPPSNVARRSHHKTTTASNDGAANHEYANGVYAMDR